MEDIGTVEAARILGVSPAEIESLEAFLADREGLADRDSAAEPIVETLNDEDRSLADELAARVSEAGAMLMIDLETGGRQYYEQVYEGRPVWPGNVSGITIGVGYDLAFYSEASFRRDWALLGQPVLDRFVNEGCIGARPPRKTPDEMKALRRRVRDLQIKWDDAIAVYKAVMLPAWALKTNNALPNCALLHGDCFGALVALTLNRGEDKYARDGDRFREMRDIKAAMQAKRFSAIPGLIRSMIRIWVGTQIETQMRRARNAEARLFEIGLAAMAAAPAAPPVTSDVEPLSVQRNVIASTRSDEDFWSDMTEEEAAAEEAEFARRILEGEVVVEMAARASVSWAPDDKSPDYAHLQSRLPVGLPFAFTADDLELLCRLNAFQLEGDDETPILFGLRGCAIVSGGSGVDGEFKTEVTLKDIRPDHKTAKCVMGVWSRADKKIGVFRGSTAPHSKGVVSHFNGGVPANILATGFYGYIVGPHIAGSSNVPGAFLLRKTIGEKRVVVVRRSEDDLTYELTDIADKCQPGDNIHPAFSDSETWFSSFGCQVVLGRGSHGTHSGQWAKFRKLAGQTSGHGDAGKEFRYVLLTGREAFIASDLRKQGLAADALTLRAHKRLRYGSSGPEVAILQEKLELSGPDGNFGPNTAAALYAFQARRNGGRCDGVFTPKLDEELGWGVFNGAVS